MTSRVMDVFRAAMSKRARSIAPRTASRSTDAFPTASLNASSDISTVGSSLVSMRQRPSITVPCGAGSRAGRSCPPHDIVPLA
jgi:hypothetical protein